MITGYWPYLIHFGIAAAFVAFLLFLTTKIKPANSDKAEKYPDTFECGVPRKGDARGMFNVRFYIVAVMFIIFDVEAVFLFPWAVSFLDYKATGLGLFILAEMTVFLIILFIGYFYMIRKGALQWEDPE